MNRTDFMVFLRKRISSFIYSESAFACMDYSRDIERAFAQYMPETLSDSEITESAMTKARALYGHIGNREKLIQEAEDAERWIVDHT